MYYVASSRRAVFLWSALLALLFRVTLTPRLPELRASTVRFGTPLVLFIARGPITLPVSAASHAASPLSMSSASSAAATS